MAVATILNFNKSVILGFHIYVFQRWWSFAILDLYYPNFGPPMTLPLIGYKFA